MSNLVERNAFLNVIDIMITMVIKNYGVGSQVRGAKLSSRALK